MRLRNAVDEGRDLTNDAVGVVDIAGIGIQLESRRRRQTVSAGDVKAPGR